jgi:signal transduction histidine kinase
VQENEHPRLVANIADLLPDVADLPPSLLPLICPLQAAGEKLGLLVVVRRAKQGFNVEEIALVISLAEQIGGAVQAQRLRRRAQRTAVLEERERIARDLHDSVTQALYGLVTFAEAGQAQLEAGAIERVDGTFARIGGATRQALKEMRLFIHQLRPDVLAEEGLVGALHLRLAAVEGRASVQARLLADETITLTQMVEEALYQIAQEALNNTLRHAGATAVTVYLSREKERVVLEIIDDGCGFTPPAPDNGGMGLHNMQQRAAAIHADLKITAVPGQGTRVRVAAPIVKE